MDKRELLAAAPLFSSFSPQQLDELAAFSVIRSYPAGKTVFEEGEQCEGLFVVGEGSVKLVKTVPSGRQIVLALERSPNTVAEVPVFDGGPYPVSVVATEPSVLLMVPRRELLIFLVHNPEIALKMLATFGRRLRHLVGLLEGVTFGSVRQRLAQLLLETSEQGVPEDGWLTLPGTHEELAQRLGTVREVISRNLSRFQAEGFIRVDRRRVAVLNPQELRREAQTTI